MTLFRSVLDAIRIQFFLPPIHGETTLTPRKGLWLAAAMLAVSGLSDVMQADADAFFQPYGLNAALALVAMAFAAILLFSGGAHPAATMHRLGILSLGALVAYALLGGVMSLIGSSLEGGLMQWGLLGLSLGLPFLMSIWTGFGARQIFRHDLTVRRPLARGLAFGCVLWLGYAAVPHWPIVESGNFRRETANYWELASAFRSSLASAGTSDPAKARDEEEERRAAIELAQPERLDAALSALESRRPGQANVFVLGVSGWGSQQVFARELNQSLAILDQRFSTAGRTIRLANNADDQDSHPLATIQNLASALRGLAARMDRENDVLLITMTSHGSQNGFALQNEGLVRRVLHPEALKAMLDRAGIRNRVVLVSACYSGAFVPVLADENTAVITASAADRSSFGCSDHRNWTYFGEAFFEHGLRGGETLAAAFGTARELVTKWESEQKLTPSRPQIHIGARLQQRLPTVIGALPSPHSALASSSVAPVY
jgi:Peptidase C13 family